MSTALALYSPQEQVALAADVWPLANRLACTEFVPKALRDRPEAVMACMLKGSELGIPLMQSLSAIHIIEGRPTMAAELMRAVVFSKGHEIEIVESNSTRCVIRGRRQGREQWQTFTRTIDDARAAGLTGKEVWKKYPADMLLARCTGALCRAVFPDCLAGISYTAEELQDGDDTLVLGTSIEDQPAAEPKKATARARQAATRGAAPVVDEPAPAPMPSRGEVPALPGEEDDIVDAELVEDGDEPDLFPPVVDDDQRVEDRRAMTGPSRIAVMMNDHGVKDRTGKQRAVFEILGRQVESTKELTGEETSTVIAFLNGLGEDVPFPFSGGEVPAPASSPDAKADTASIAPSPPPPRNSTEDWSGDEWRALIGRRKIKVTELLSQARRLKPGLSIGTLDELAGLGVADELYGWVEDTALDRGGS